MNENKSSTGNTKSRGKLSDKSSGSSVKDMKKRDLKNVGKDTFRQFEAAHNFRENLDLRETYMSKTFLSST